MKAIVNSSAGAGIADVSDPRPAAGEALVAVRAFSVNRGELALLAARTNDWRPGQDIAGVVVEQAADGSGPPPGTRIVALAEQAGWSELAAVPTARLSALPDEVSVEQAAALPLAGLTALRTLRLDGDLLGRRALVTGASGGLGGMQVQLAVAAGYLSYAYPEPPGPDLAILVGLVSARRLDPVLGLVDAWTRLPEAIQALTERRITGKAVLTIG